MLHSYKYSVKKLRGSFESESESAARGLAVQTGLYRLGLSGDRIKNESHLSGERRVILTEVFLKKTAYATTTKIQRPPNPDRLSPK